MSEILNQEDLENYCNDFEKKISGYSERIAVLNFEYVQDFHLSFRWCIKKYADIK